MLAQLVMLHNQSYGMNKWANNEAKQNTARKSRVSKHGTKNTLIGPKKSKK